MSLESKAKTIYELMQARKEWLQDFSDGALGNQEAYARARDTRYLFEQGVKWVPLKESQEAIKEVHKDYIEEYEARAKLKQKIAEVNKILDDFSDFYSAHYERNTKILEHLREVLK